jgi:hypothetical protein
MKVKAIDLQTPIAEVPGFPIRVKNALSHEKVKTLDELIKFKKPLVNVKNLGAGSIKQVEKTLAGYGLEISPDAAKTALKRVADKRAVGEPTPTPIIKVPQEFYRINKHLIKREQICAVGPVKGHPGKYFYDVFTLGGPIRMRFVENPKAKHSREYLVNELAPKKD